MGVNKRAKFDSLISLSRARLIQVLTGLLFLYLLFISFEIPMVLRAGLGLETPEIAFALPLISHQTQNDNQFSTEEKEELVFRAQERKMGEFRKISGLIFDDNAFNSVRKLENLKSGKVLSEVENQAKRAEEPCPNSVELSGDDFVKKGKMMVIPCGLSLGSHITIVGRPRWAHMDKESNKGGGSTIMSQFLMELQGLRTVDGEDPPRILHFNPRLKGIGVGVQ
ncbi:UNVERIFIED_CONTAM: Hydroxyproline O-galactosyltransferase GALT4 [Sesamum calycinum]|uniref:Galectin n=1 Tax=Sesamum calycinum TaxID=2727403 RepID=A0AAW2PSM2_9LAMI